VEYAYRTCGVYWIIPGFIGISYSIDGSRIRVCLRLIRWDVACGHIDPSHPCVNLNGNVLMAKASIEVCLEGRCLTYKAKACYKETPFSSWKCTEASGTIICF
jgi:hypothetical protein